MEMALSLIHNLNLFLDSVGIILFGAIVFTTIKNKILHGNCHLLIGFYCFCSLFSKTMLPLMALCLLPSIATMPPFNWPAFCILPISAMDGIFPLMFCIGFDRMLSIRCPIWYIKRRPLPQLCFMFSLAIVYMAFVAILVLQNLAASTDSDTPVLFQMANISGNSSTIRNCELAFICLTFCCYAVMAFTILCGKGQQQGQFRQTLFKSMGLVVLIQIVAWLAALGLYALIPTLEIGPIQKTLSFNAVDCILSVVTSSEVALLYFTSSNHRKALQKDFKWILACFPGMKTSPPVKNIVVMAAPARQTCSYHI